MKRDEAAAGAFFMLVNHLMGSSFYGTFNLVCHAKVNLGSKWMEGGWFVGGMAIAVESEIKKLMLQFHPVSQSHQI